MKKHCGNCANHKKETNQFSEECGKCVEAILENGEMCRNSEMCGTCPMDGNCPGGSTDFTSWMQWLKQPAEE